MNITISLDGVGQTYEYIRTNANWLQVKSNIIELLEERHNSKSLQIGFSFIIQMYSIFNIIYVLNFCKKIKDNNYINLRIHILLNLVVKNFLVKYSLYYLQY